MSQLKKVNTEEKENKIFVHSVDYAFLVATVLLVLVGVVMVFSASYYTAGNSKECNFDIYFYLKKQGLWAAIGFAIMYVVCNINYIKLKKLIFPFYLICNIFLVAVLIVGKEVNGAKRWLELGPIGFQPSEIAKIAMILQLSYYISKHKKILTNFIGFLRCFVIIAIPAFFIAVENMSTAIVITLIGISVMFVASPKIRYFVIPSIIAILSGVAMVLFGDAFRMKRFQAWLDPFSDPRGIGYQTIQSLYAIGSGGLFGLGLGQSRQKLGYIPEGHNDTIFAIVCEELGLFGAAILVLLFIILIWRGINIAMNSVDMFGCLIATGIIVMIAVQVILNIAVVTNTIPNTGIPLPFISYGGTALVFMMGSAGLILNISRYSKENKRKQ